MFRSVPGGCLLSASLLGAWLFMSAPVVAADEPVTLKKLGTVEGITEYSLSNGLRILLFPDDSKPLVTVNCTVFVGSRHEGYGETGMAHLLEHMVFKGTPTFPNVPKALRDHGARFNGTTWVDRTNYFETMPATDENLEFGIKLEADRLVNSYIKREDLVSEMTVVRNEFEAGENNPEAILSQRMMATAYEWHNYGKSTIGNRSDIERVPIENLQAFYRKYYQVDNAMLVVAGKFDEKKALEYIVKYFGALKRPQRQLTNTYTEEPPQDGERLVTLRRVGTVAATGVVYHIPAGAHPDFAACQILEDILTSEPAGRLYEALVQTKIASSVNGSAFAWHDPGVIEIIAKTEPEKLEQARKTLIDTLENLAAKPITEEEVERSKRRFAKFNEQLLASTDRLAVQLSEWAACGDWRLFFLHRDRIEKVTAAEVNRVAAKYLTRNNRTVGVFVPEKEPQRAEIPPTPNVAELVKDYKGREQIAQGEAFDPTPENIEKRVQRGKISGTGVAYALLPKKTRGEVVHLQLNLRFGSEQSLLGRTTAAELLGSMLLRGTEEHTRKQLQDEFDKLSARVSIGSDVGVLTVTVQVKKPNLLPTLKLLQEVLRKPTFPADEFELLKREQREQLDKGLTEPTNLASRELQRRLNPFPNTSIRYVPTLVEEIAQLDATTLAQVKELYAKQLGSAVGELAVVGDFDVDSTLAAFTQMLAGWKAEVPFERIDRPAATLTKGDKILIPTPDKANAVYLAGMMIPMKDSDPDYGALLVGNFIYGGAPLASRLSNRVRGEEGLSYGIGSGVRADAVDLSASFTIFAITNPKNMGKVEDIIAQETRKFLAEGPSLAELTEGKKAFVETLKVQRTDDRNLARQLTTALQAGRTYAFYAELEKAIQALTPQQVKAAFQKHLPAEKLIIVEAGDFPAKK